MPIYDLSYRRIEGTRKAESWRFLPIAAVGFRNFFKKKMNLVLLLLAVAPYFIGAFVLLSPLILSGSEELGDSLRRFLHITADAAYLGMMKVSFWFVLVLGLAAGSGAIANDMTSNALEIYFSRPITRFDYVLGKLGTVVSVMALGSLAPMLLLCVLDIAVANEPGYFGRQLPVVLRIIAAHAVLLVAIGLLVLAVSSLVKSQRNATVVFAAILMGTFAFSGILLKVTRDRDWLLIDFKAPFDRVVYDVLGVAAEGAEADANAIPGDRESERIRMMSSRLRGGYTVAARPLQGSEAISSILAVAAWYAAAVFVLSRRVRGFEVVKGG
jgi:ABC-2 type transport system permease protein